MKKIKIIKKVLEHLCLQEEIKKGGGCNSVLYGVDDTKKVSEVTSLHLKGRKITRGSLKELQLVDLKTILKLKFPLRLNFLGFEAPLKGDSFSKNRIRVGGSLIRSKNFSFYGANTLRCISFDSVVHFNKMLGICLLSSIQYFRGIVIYSKKCF